MHAKCPTSQRVTNEQEYKCFYAWFWTYNASISLMIQDFIWSEIRIILKINLEMAKRANCKHTIAVWVVALWEEMLYSYSVIKYSHTHGRKVSHSYAMSVMRALDYSGTPIIISIISHGYMQSWALNNTFTVICGLKHAQL